MRAPKVIEVSRSYCIHAFDVDPGRDSHHTWRAVSAIMASTSENGPIDSISLFHAGFRDRAATSLPSEYPDRIAMEANCT